MLASKFDFDITEAREFLGLPLASKRGRPAKDSSAGTGSLTDLIRKLTSDTEHPKKAKLTADQSTARNPSHQ